MPGLLHPRDSHTSEQSFEMEDSDISRVSSRQVLLGLSDHVREERKSALAGMARHTLGLLLLLCVVFLWTLSNFLGSSIFADNTYAKPFFLTYLNTSMFMLAMIPTLLRSAYHQHQHGTLGLRLRLPFWRRRRYVPLSAADPDASPANNDSLNPKSPILHPTCQIPEEAKHLGIIPTARLSLAFCILWFGANYFAMSCLQYTTVASTTILTSTSSFWTLLIGAITRTERFTWRKFSGVLGSFIGIILVSRADFSAQATENDDVNERAIDPFPDKSPSEMALGDALALFSAVLYGIYTITLKQSTIKALPRSLNMSLFFGLVGAFNFILLLPLFPLLHWVGLEKFEFPPTQRIWTVLLVNSVSSLFSDICWAYAMVLTSPLVVTVGLSLTIPLSLVGEMVLQGRYEGWIYWLGAAIVVGSFLFVDAEEKKEEDEQDRYLDGDSLFHDEGSNEAVDVLGSENSALEVGTSSLQDHRPKMQPRRRSSIGHSQGRLLLHESGSE